MYKFRVILNCLTEGAKNDALLSERFLESGLYRYTVNDRVDGDSGESLLLFE